MYICLLSFYIYMSWGWYHHTEWLLIVSIEIKQVTGYARDAKILMRSTVGTCPRVGARCYLPLLGITKEIVSQGPQVLDMEYREPDWLEHGPGGPIFSFFSASTLSVAAASITISLFLCQRWFLLHEVMSLGIMVCVTLILKTFEYVHLILFASNVCLDLMLFHLTTPGENDRMP